MRVFKQVHSIECPLIAGKSFVDSMQRQIHFVEDSENEMSNMMI